MIYIYRKFILLMFISAFLISCSDWNDIDPKYGVDGIGVGVKNDEDYYKNLRAFKATMFDRKISFAWFGGWNAQGAYMKSSLAGLPDSLDVVSLWGNWSEPSEAMRADLQYVQKVRGTKVVGCDLIGDIGQGYTPEDADFNEYWDWEGDLNPINKNEKPTEKQKAAIRKFARTVVEAIEKSGLDGYDIDYEIGWGSKGNLVEYYYRMIEYVDELGKYLGPKSGTGKLLLIDGAICNIPKETGPYFDWLVIQAYRASSNRTLNTGRNRFGKAVANLSSVMPVEEIAQKIVMTEEYEQGQNKTGGVPFKLDDGTIVNSLKGMAMWQPIYGGTKFPRSGGCGVYHIEYEYDETATNGYTGFYPWIREAIQIMNPSPANQK